VSLQVLRPRDIHSQDVPLAGLPRSAYGGDMASDPQLELRVSRLENDTSSIYDLLTEVRSTQQDHSRRFGVIDGRLGVIDGRLDAIDGRLDAMDHRFDTIDGRLDGMDRRFDAIDHRFDTIDGRLDAMDRRFDTIGHRFDTIETTLTEVVRRLPEPS